MFDFPTSLLSFFPFFKKMIFKFYLFLIFPSSFYWEYKVGFPGDSVVKNAPANAGHVV